MLPQELFHPIVNYKVIDIQPLYVAVVDFCFDVCIYVVFARGGKVN